MRTRVLIGICILLLSIFIGTASELTDATLITTINGEAPDDRLHTTPQCINGDVNNDGYDDVIAGAWGNDAGGSNAGRMYIYLGGSTMDNSADIIFTGEAANDELGDPAAFAGDVNGDGYDDVIVAAPYNDAGGIDAGRAYILFGGDPMDNVADVIITGSAGNELGAWSANYAGDVNNDGYDDVIVGACYKGAGFAYIYLGGSSMDNAADIVLVGESDGDRFGCLCSYAGDVNNDGFDDVIVGAPDSDAGGTDSGRAYIYFGGSSMDSTPDVSMTGAGTGDRFGYVGPAGNVNNDGYDDVIVGARGGDKAYIFLGGSPMDNIADVTMSGESSGDFFGYGTGTVGDANNDGYDDVIVGAPYNAGSGKAYIYFRGSSMNNTPDITMTGESNDGFGMAVGFAGDVNGDGNKDFTIAAPQNNINGRGRTYIYTVIGTSSIIANFTANVTTGNAPITVQFTDTSTGSPTSWEWDFGDGGISTEQNPIHTYIDEGSYTVNLTVSNEHGSDTETKIDYITVILNGILPMVKIDPPLTSGLSPSDTFSVNISIDSKTYNLKGSTLDLTYNASALTVNIITEGDLLGSPTITEPGSGIQQPGLIHYGITRASGNTPVPSSGTFITIHFIVNNDASNGTYMLNLSNATLNDENNAEIPGVDVIDGSVIVGGRKGDLKGDGDIDWYDFLAFADAYNSVSGDPNYTSAGDFDDDGDIDWYDFLAFADVYNT